MSIFDVVLLLVLFVFLAIGFRAGFLHALGSVLGIIIGVLVANRYYEDVATLVLKYFAGHELLIKVVVYLTILVLISKLTGTCFWIVEKVLGIVPFFGTLNKVTGAILGLVEGILICGLILTFIARFPYISSVTKELANSKVAPTIMQSSQLIIPFLPKEFNNLEPLNLNLLEKVKTMTGDKWKEYQNLQGTTGAEKLDQLKHLLQ